MGSDSTDRKVELQLKQLCSLGLNSELFVPKLIEILWRHFRLSYAAFLWADEHGTLSNCYLVSPAGNLAPITELYLSEFHERREREVANTFSEALRLELPTVYRMARMLKVEALEYRRHDFFNLIWQPVDADIFNCLNVTVREPARTFGILQISRGFGQPQFKDCDERLLERLAPYVAHALSCSVAFQGPWVDSAERGLVILDREGKIEHLSPNARSLLLQAGNPHFNAPVNDPFGAMQSMERVLVRLRANLHALFQDGGLVEAPVFHLQNPWGRFSFRAYWLDPQRQDSGGRIGIIVQRQEPMALKLLRALETTNLSASERGVALLIANADSYADIARKLSISERTVVAHSQHIFAKLDVRNRKELLTTLLAEDR